MNDLSGYFVSPGEVEVPVAVKGFGLVELWIGEAVLAVELFGEHLEGKLLVFGLECGLVGFYGGVDECGYFLDSGEAFAEPESDLVEQFEPAELPIDVLDKVLAHDQHVPLIGNESKLGYFGNHGATHVNTTELNLFLSNLKSVIRVLFQN